MDAAAVDLLGEPEQILWFRVPEVGLEAVLVIDSTVLGPAAGGIRTRAYPDRDAAVADARALARAMTIKCAVAGLDAGGAKMVVLDHSGLDRARAFPLLGEGVEALGGRFRTAGDLGTTAADLEAMAAVCRYVHTAESRLEDAAGVGLERCLDACAGRLGLERATVAIQGCGAIGVAVARELATAGHRLQLADVIADRARLLAAELGCETVAADRVLAADVDVLCPCAAGGAIDLGVARELRARAVCGAANNIFAGARAELELTGRGVLVVPDVVASAGAAVAGLAPSLMRVSDIGPLLERLGTVAGEIIDASAATGRPPSAIANEIAATRLNAATAAGRGQL